MHEPIEWAAHRAKQLNLEYFNAAVHYAAFAVPNTYLRRLGFSVSDVMPSWVQKRPPLVQLVELSSSALSADLPTSFPAISLDETMLGDSSAVTNHPSVDASASLSSPSSSAKPASASLPVSTVTPTTNLSDSPFASESTVMAHSAPTSAAPASSSPSPSSPQISTSVTSLPTAVTSPQAIATPLPSRATQSSSLHLSPGDISSGSLSSSLAAAAAMIASNPTKQKSDNYAQTLRLDGIVFVNASGWQRIEPMVLHPIAFGALCDMNRGVARGSAHQPFADQCKQQIFQRLCVKTAVIEELIDATDCTCVTYL